MNKFNIKVYVDGVLDINRIYYAVNSIKYHNNIFNNNAIIKFRIIDYNNFGIKLFINRLDE